MDVDRVLDFLRAEREKLDRVIRSLEELQAITSHAAASQQRRGRKSMGEEERRIVSARMKRFWAERRKKHPTPL